MRFAFNISRPALKWVAASGFVACALFSVVLVAAGLGPVKKAESGQKSPPNESADQSPSNETPVDPFAEADAGFRKDVHPFLKQYCLGCHDDENQRGGLSLESFIDTRSVTKDRETWQSVADMLELEVMPPEDAPKHPSGEQREQVLSWVSENLFAVDCTTEHDPGRVTIRRLNRAEYNNTIRDLMGVDFQPAEDFPSDEVGYGFDNIGDVLSLPPLLLEKYVDAAEQITEDAIWSDPTAKLAQRVAVEKLDHDGGSDRRGDAISISSTGSAFQDFDFPRDGKYILRAEAAADQAGDEPAKMEFRIDGQKQEVFEIKGHRERGVYETTVEIQRGKRKFAAAFINDYYNPRARNRRERDRNLAVMWLEVQGPLGGDVDSLPETHRRIVIARPGDDKSVANAAREIFAAFLPRAFRRPIQPGEVDPYVKLVEFVVSEGESFERGVQVGVQAVLVSAHFLFRIETDAEPNNPDRTRPLDDFELANRLSYFLWSSMPDAELFELAKKNQLHRSSVLRKQVQRMLADSKSKALTENFASQWLNLRNLEEMTPDPNQFEQFDNELRADMRRETELLFESIVRDDRSILDFLAADFTYVNERLAKHYGIESVEGDEFHRVSLEGTDRRGVLTHASILTLTSNPTRTSPVKRGKWILENLLDSSPPDPPADVPELEETSKENPNSSLREQLELHRSNATCASCHKVMDPLGLGFENFDAIGRYREKDGRLLIDPSGELPSGERFSGPIELIQILKSREEEFTRCLARKLLTYALGRGLEYYDTCAVQEIVKSVQQNDYRFSALVQAIVESDPFLMRRGDDN